jgi:GNAT superfamily N-acetyltransferase
MMSFLSLYSTVRKKFSTGGIKNTFLLMAQRIYCELFHSKNLFFAIDLSNYKPDERSINENITVLDKASFDQLTEDEQEVFKGYGGSALLDLFKKRFESGHRVFLTYYSGEVVGASWIYKGGPGKFFMIPLETDEFFILAVFIIEKFRGRGISSASLASILQRMKEYGFQKGFICTKEWNFYQNSIKKAGFEFIGKVREIKAFKKNILIWSSVNRKNFP